MADNNILPLNFLERIQQLRDPGLYAEVPLAKGLAPGIWELMQTFYPPRRVVREMSCVEFSIQVSEETFPLWFVPYLWAKAGDTTYLIGRLPTSEAHRLFLGATSDDSPHLFAAVRYDPVKRTGAMFLTGKTCQEIRRMLKLPDDVIFPPQKAG